ncbi:MAG: response regulator transcription factor [bacterium]
MKILLIEDDLRIAGFIQKGLHEIGHTTFHASDGYDGLDLALNEDFDIGVFDLMLPGLNGLSIIERMRQQHLKIPVIILSAMRTVDDRVRGLQQGGDDYLTKPFSFSELAARIQALIRRSGPVQNESMGIIEIEDLCINLLSREVRRGDVKIRLQPREFSLLEFLARHQGQVVSKTMIIERVWNYTFDPQTNIVEARISKLREKIDRGFRFPLIHTVRGLGYILKQSGD